MQQIRLIVSQKETIASAWWRLTLTAPDLTSPCRPGQFFLLRCADRFTCYLRRPIFPQPQPNQQFTLLIRPDPDPGLAWLTARQVGDRLDVVGPLGSGFDLPDGIQNLLLISNSQWLAPLLGLMEQAVAAGLSVTMALGARRAVDLYPVSTLPPVVEFQAATLDGSLGHSGQLTDLLPDLLPWADRVCAIGSARLYRAIRAQTEAVRFGILTGFAYGLLTDLPLPCGVGACCSCTRYTNTGAKLTCLDGPVFDLAEVEV
ncbi:MAG TPA: hypothetical protein P5526_21660 [Anaerolineae bacterium]|nr:hypothetical protein [Anaerolineae bacterium]HRV94781.1 hypothetical protein [Anaerolineae bacterium]